MKNHSVKDLVAVKYHAFNSPPFPFDAEGFVETSALIDWQKNDWYVRWENDEPFARKGYVMVYIDEGDPYVVREKDMYTEVFEDERLEGGYGLNYPTGGMASTHGYDLVVEHEGRTVMLQRSCW